MLDVPDPDFFKGLKPLEIGGIPQLESSVSVYGYPIGGERLIGHARRRLPGGFPDVQPLGGG